MARKGPAASRAEPSKVVVAAKRNAAGNLETKAGFFSQLTFSFLNRIMAMASKGNLDAGDLGTVHPHFETEAAYGRFQHYLDIHIAEQKAKGRKPGLFKVLFKTVGIWTILLAGLLAALQAAIQLLVPRIFSSLISGISDPTTEAETLWMYAGAFFVLPIVGSLVNNAHDITMARSGLIMKNALGSAIYRKSLTVDLTRKKAGVIELNQGTIVNLMSNDANRLTYFMYGMNNLWIAPATVTVGMYLLYSEVSWATFIGVAVLALSGPVNGILFSKIHKVYKDKMTAQDERVKLIQEMLNGVRIIKFYAWENPFMARIRKTREKELKAVLNFLYLIALGFQLVIGSSVVIMQLTVFIFYSRVIGEVLTPAKAFTALMLFGIVRGPFISLPMNLVGLLQAKTSVDRVVSFLAAPDMQPKDALDATLAAEDEANGVVLHIRNGEFSYIHQDEVEAEAKEAAEKKAAEEAAAAKKGASAPAAAGAGAGAGAGEEEDTKETDEEAEERTKNFKLVIPDLAIKKGEFVAIVGSVGSGKTSILNALLSEIPKTGGRCDTLGTIAYASQQAWIVNATVRNNILFHQEFDREFYNKVKVACALEADLEVLQGGDQCEIGERGINLSGGQKARVSLARAAYANTDIILADDPLAAVDAHVGEAIFNKCFKELLADKTRILVTNQLSVLPHVDRILVVVDGELQQMGTYHELCNEEGEFKSLLERLEQEEVMSDEEEEGGLVVEEEIDLEATVLEGDDAPTRSRSGSAAGRPRTKSRARTRSRARSRARSRQSTAAGKEEGKLTEEEHREKGLVAASAYSFYFKAVSTPAIIAVLFAMAVTEAGRFATTFWLGNATDGFIGKTGDDLTSAVDTFLLVYGLLTFSMVAAMVLQGVISAKAMLNASATLHEALVVSVLRAPTAFFDITPVGRIMNRFSKDIDSVDYMVGRMLSAAVGTAAALVGAIVGMVVSTKGFALIVLVPVLVLYYFVASYIRRAAVEVQRIDSVTKSPVYASFSETLHGLSTVRAYNKGKTLVDVNVELVNNNAVPAFTLQLMQKWLSTRLDFLGACVSFGVAAFAVVLSTGDDVDFVSVGWIAISLNYANQLTSTLQGLVESVAIAEAQMASVERVQEFATSIQAEAAWEKDSDPKQGTWPSAGNVVIEDLKLRYRDGPLVLKGVTANIKACEKIGVVGRTGAGKSSMMNALFRIEEAAGGKVVIDGRDIADMGLATLRSNIVIIPQDPVLFTGSLRYNLDPFDQYDDAAVWAALENVNLKGAVHQLKGQLLEEVAEGGTNFSVGQRQLICMARALLRKPKILIMDEATASVDQETDANVQRMIRVCFEQCTVLTIAHRLETIMDSDRIMVMADGVVAEFKSPAELIDDETSVLHGMCAATGNLVQLQRIAHGEAGFSAEHAHATPVTGTVEADEVDVDVADEDAAAPE